MLTPRQIERLYRWKIRYFFWEALKYRYNKILFFRLFISLWYPMIIQVRIYLTKKLFKFENNFRSFDVCFLGLQVKYERIGGPT